MGGRGSAGGRAGGGNISMPELRGSARQVSWASDIRETALSSVEAIVRNAERGERSGLGYSGPNGFPITLKAAQTVRTEVREAFAQMDSASTIINNRRELTHARFERMAEAETRSGEISAARRRRRSR